MFGGQGFWLRKSDEVRLVVQNASATPYIHIWRIHFIDASEYAA